ncbi:MAG TPA: hypothetical protein VHV80_01945 [Steroidobacteraceae bacterium]|jgi:hypothetical protein|nr:hypothetical protein [Steroidobacteraceae bacterium]
MMTFAFAAKPAGLTSGKDGLQPWLLDFRLPATRFQLQPINRCSASSIRREEGGAVHRETSPAAVFGDGLDPDRRARGDSAPSHVR